MLLDLNDPVSILAWWKVWPQRHDAFLAHALRASPQFSHAIREAQRWIAGSAELRSLLASSVKAHRDAMATGAYQGFGSSTPVLRLAEMGEIADMAEPA